MLSNTCKYALRSTIYIALKVGEDKKIGLKTISENLEIPAPFLGKILQILAKQKILNSTKGPNGGFSLMKRDNELTILDIVKVIDGMDYFTECLIGLKSCNGEHNGSPCPTNYKYEPIRKQVYELFSTTTIKSLAEDIESSEGLINI